MNQENVDKSILERAQKWLDGNYDRDTKATVRSYLVNDQTTLIDAFYKDLEFGTGGLRGIMGVGTNRMNKYTVGSATQGLANYLKKMFAGRDEIKAVIAYDSRNNSRYFSEVTADVLSANGIKVYLFDALRPTPELSFAIRHLGCQTGVMITASHNPKEYNGYKVYWEDGGQLIKPHDKNIIEEVKRITDVNQINFEGDKNKIEAIGEKIDKVYIDKVKSLTLNPDIIQKHKDLKIVYTPIHGTGVELVPRALKALGFEQIYNVAEQDKVDGDFPTVHSPNPEEPAALEMALEKAREVNAELVMATDPDTDRAGLAVKDHKGEYVLLNGNQTATLLIYYVLGQYKEKDLLKGNEYIVKTIVTTELLDEMARDFGVEIFDVLTGFKYIADVIKRHEGKKKFIAGGEESYGFLVGDFVRDKDAVIYVAMMAETAAWAAEQGKSLNDLLIDIYQQYGLYKEKLKSVVRYGKAGAEHIAKMMDEFRSQPPVSINDSKVSTIIDYQKGTIHDIDSGEEEPTSLPKSNVIQFYTKCGSKITARPSGTEPKIKFYVGVKRILKNKEDFEKINAKAEEELNKIIEALDIE
ncbi:MAG: phospho-sugar mutase [Bacteroidales bacterium]|nr:phospho-sugar mutase [Bacteroidales bacterium]